MITDERYKEIMSGLGHLNSRSLLLALKQVEQESSPSPWDLHSSLKYLKDQGYSGLLEDLYKTLPSERQGQF